MFRQNCFQLRFSFNPSGRVFTILSRTFVSPFMAALSTGPTIEKKSEIINLEKLNKLPSKVFSYQMSVVFSAPFSFMPHSVSLR